MWFDYMIFMLPAMLLAGAASLYTKGVFSKYERVPSQRGFSGAQAAAYMLDAAGIHDVSIEPVRGFLSDHYDPTAKTLRLSPNVYGGRSLSAIGVACHEAGHAIQHAKSYAPLTLRTLLVPAAQFGGNFAMIFFMVGLIFSMMPLVKLAIGIFTAAVVFSIITLPVEWDASSRAKQMMVQTGLVTPAERDGAAAVLNAAFLTYVAAAITAIMTLLYYLARAGLLGRSD